MIKATMEWVEIPIVLWTRAPVQNQKEARQIHGPTRSSEVERCGSPGRACHHALPPRPLSRCSHASSWLLPRRGAPGSCVTWALPTGGGLERGRDAAARRGRSVRGGAAGAGQGAGRGGDESLPVLAADTEVLLDGHILGKPRTSATRSRCCGVSRAVRTRSSRASAWCAAASPAPVSSAAWWPSAPMSDGELAWYATTGEPLDKAGGYHVDGKGALFIETVEGSPSNVAVWPVRLLLRLVREAGLDVGCPTVSVLARPAVLAWLLSLAAADAAPGAARGALAPGRELAQVAVLLLALVGLVARALAARGRARRGAGLVAVGGALVLVASLWTGSVAVPGR